jgi:hypothetical protein
LCPLQLGLLLVKGILPGLHIFGKLGFHQLRLCTRKYLR